MKKLLVLLLLFAAPVRAALLPSPPFTAVNAQGRPMVGGSIAVTDSSGDPVVPCSNAACTGGGQTQIGPSGVFQFWAIAGTYNVTLAASGISRIYTATIPAGIDAITNGDFGSNTGWMRRINTSGSYTAHKVNLTASVDPTVNDDGGDGYSIGSFWFNTSDNVVCFCTDASPGAAEWACTSAGGSGVTSINGEDGDITVQFGTLGTQPNVTVPGPGVIQLNIPNASVTNRGLVTTGAQGFAGVKVFQDDVQVNEKFSVLSDVGTVGFNFDNFASTVQMFTLDESGRVTIDNPTGSMHTLYVTNSGTGDAVHGFNSVLGFGVVGEAQSGSVGGGIKGMSNDGDAFAAEFVRNLTGTVPVVAVDRNNSSDTQTLLALRDTTATTAATYAASYSLNNGTVKNGLQTNGQVVASDGTGVGTPGFAFLGDLDSGLDESSGSVCLIDEATAGLCLTGSGVNTLTSIVGGVAIATGITANPAIAITSFSTGDDFAINTTEFRVVGGEATWSGISGDGTGKVVCVKSDGFTGTCTSVVDSSGVCTCA